MSTKITNYNDRFVIINIKSHTGDKIKLNLPMEFVKKVIKNNAIDFFLFEEEIIDSQKLVKYLTDAFKYDLTGEIAYLQRYNGDIVKIKVE
ncbi:MAG: hypothetical protein RSD36_13825 [Terrisporobacter sp.]